MFKMTSRSLFAPLFVACSGIACQSLALAEADQRILGCNYGSTVPERDIPRLVDELMSGELDLESMISARRPLGEVESALADLDAGGALRQLLLP